MSENEQINIQEKIFEYDNIKYLINEEENTADVVGCKIIHDKIIIQRSIKYKTKEYLIINILENVFEYSDIKLVQFKPYSKIQSIEKGAFSGSSIESITIPSELVDLKEGWCDCTSKLTKITVSPNNPRYCCIGGKMIIGKTNIDQSNYDCLIFCVRDIQRIKIPNFIEHICACSFNQCNELDEVEFSNDSKLQTIDENAFTESAIKRITIPPSVTLIGEGSLSDCQQLKQIEISSDSKLQKIDKYAFFLPKL